MSRPALWGRYFAWLVVLSSTAAAGVIALALLGVTDALHGFLPLAAARREHPEQIAAAASAARAATKPKIPKIVYLNREGALLVAGVDDASKNVASLVRSAGHASVAFPAFDGSFSQWTAIVDCLRDRFEPYGVAIVDQRPVEPDYIMAMIGGTANAFDAADAIAGEDHEHAVRTGLSPFNGEMIPGAVVLVFSSTLRNNVRAVCETAGMEIGHAYGLDHAMDCQDLMTYLPACGPRRFVDKAVPCGEQRARACRTGGALQNSHARLLELLGPG